MSYSLNENLFDEDVLQEPIRAGFGRGLKAAGELDERVVALCADLTESTQMHLFRDAFSDRYIQVGIAEQNLAALASGLAHAGKISFASSYAAFNPGRNWEQIKTTIALNNQPVKIIGSHAGVSVGPDGATHQMLEDIAITRVIPNMVVIAPGDSLEAEKATKAIAVDSRPTYMRLAREKTAVFSTADSPFEIGQAYVIREGQDVSLLGTGTMTYQLLVAAEELSKKGIAAEVVHVPTIKPLDAATILQSIKKTGRAVSAEEAQIKGGFGGALAELFSEQLPTPLKRIGMDDRFGESGEPKQLVNYFGMDGLSIANTVAQWLEVTPKYHQGF